jgi:N-(2-amino-2-carboxyethyl)-L-glutamate synthase
LQELQGPPLLTDSYWPNQYANEANPAAHYGGTMAEIAESLSHQVDFIFCPTSFCGTLAGCSRYVRVHSLRTTVIAVDAAGSVLFNSRRTKRRIPGLGKTKRRNTS